MTHERPIDSEGRLPLPKAVREELDLEAGDTVSIELEDGELRISPDATEQRTGPSRRRGSPAQVGRSASQPLPGEEDAEAEDETGGE